LPQEEGGEKIILVAGLLGGENLRERKKEGGKKKVNTSALFNMGKEKKEGIGGEG